MNIVLIGMRGSGKTTIGKVLAKKLNMSFLDFDIEIERVTNKKIEQIVESEGWNAFRTYEADVAKMFVNKNAVIATGGGVITNQPALDVVTVNAYVVFIDCDAVTIVERLKTEPRPKLTSMPLKEEVSKVLNERYPLYLQQAHLHIPHCEKKTPLEIAESIIASYEQVKV